MTTVGTRRTSGVLFGAGRAETELNRHPATVQRTSPRNTPRRPLFISAYPTPPANPRPKRLLPVNRLFYCQPAGAGRYRDKAIRGRDDRRLSAAVTAARIAVPAITAGEACSRSARQFRAPVARSSEERCERRVSWPVHGVGWSCPSAGNRQPKDRLHAPICRTPPPLRHWSTHLRECAGR